MRKRMPGLIALAFLLSCFALSGCERHIVFEDGIMLEEVSVGKAYVERIPWHITMVEIDQAKQRCLFEMENTEQGTTYSQWASEGDYLTLDAEQSQRGIVVHQIEKGKAVLGIPYGRGYSTYHPKKW